MVRLLRRARPYWPHIASVFLLGLLATPLALLAPVPLENVVDGVLGGRPPPGVFGNIVPAGASPEALLLMAVALLVVIAVATQLQQLATDLLQTWTGERLVMDFRSELFRHVQRLLRLVVTGGEPATRCPDQYDAASIQYVAIDGDPAVRERGRDRRREDRTWQRRSTLHWRWWLWACARSCSSRSGAMRQRLRSGSRELKKLESGVPVDRPGDPRGFEW